MTKEARRYNGIKTVPSVSGVRKTNQIRAERETTFLHHILKNPSKLIEDLNVRPETMKLLEGNIGSKLFDVALSIIFLEVSMGEGKKINK